MLKSILKKQEFTFTLNKTTPLGAGTKLAATSTCTRQRITATPDWTLFGNRCRSERLTCIYYFNPQNHARKELD